MSELEESDELLTECGKAGSVDKEEWDERVNKPDRSKDFTTVVWVTCLMGSSEIMLS